MGLRRFNFELVVEVLVTLGIFGYLAYLYIWLFSDTPVTAITYLLLFPFGIIVLYGFFIEILLFTDFIKNTSYLSIRTLTDEFALALAIIIQFYLISGLTNII